MPARMATVWRWAELNPAVYAPGATTATTNQRRPLFPDFAGIVSIESTGRSEYNSPQLTLEKRMARGFTILNSYTLSKTRDHAGENKQTGATQTNPTDLDFDWGFANSIGATAGSRRFSGTCPASSATRWPPPS